MSAPLVTNAADRQHVQFAMRKVKSREALFFNALRAMLQSADARLVIAEMLDRAGLYKGGYEPSGSKMYYNEGVRSSWLELRTLCELADDAAVALMDRERRARGKRDDTETAAAHTAAASEGDPNL